jgi:hypothetical protein
VYVDDNLTIGMGIEYSFESAYRILIELSFFFVIFEKIKKDVVSTK